MAFVKVLKNKAYFKRYQVKKRRRREGKTHYYARMKMIRQDKDKYNAKKYRLIVRFTNSRVICQIAFPTIKGDRVVAQATSDELGKYGIPAGYKNYAAAYATGLLIARRTLTRYKMQDLIKGKEAADGTDYHVEEEDHDRRPFKCILDVGRQTTSSGANMWGALKGAVDGGLHIPHNTKKFPGYKKAEGKKSEPEYDAEAHKERIFGGHVKDYMVQLAEEDPTKYQAQFKKFVDAGKEGDDLEGMYADAHKKIRADPVHKPKAKKDIKHVRTGANLKSSDKSEHVRNVKITLKERREKVASKIAAARAKLLAAEE